MQLKRIYAFKINSSVHVMQKCCVLIGGLFFGSKFLRELYTENIRVYDLGYFLILIYLEHVD